MTIELFENTKIKFLSNNLGESINSEDSEVLKKWLLNTIEENGWSYYLTEYNNQDCLLATLGFSHLKDNSPKEKVFTLEEKEASSNEVFSKVEKIAYALEQKIPYDILIGNSTGTSKRHELIIVFPYEVTNEDIVDTLKEVKPLL